MEDNRAEIFAQLKELVEKYNPPFLTGTNNERWYDLYSIKDVEIQGRKRKEVWFAGIIIQKAYVGFYFMPVYAEPERKATFKPELLKLLKGKSCFHIRKLDNELLIQIEEALEEGFEMFKERGWV
jgi:hypothetical protein